jgi:phosphopantothenate synthetase
MMMPVEVIILGGIISILSLIERLIRYIPKLNRHIDRLTRSKSQLESLKETISIKDNSELGAEDIKELTDLIDTLADLGEELNFIKP